MFLSSTLSKKATMSGLRETCHKCLSRRHRGRALVCKTGRKKDRHSARARDEWGVSIWAEIRMRWGELLENADRAQKPNS